MTKTNKAAGAGASPAIRRFMRRAAVCEATGLPTSSLYALMQKGKFPKPINLSEGRVAWLEEDIAKWQADRLAEREQDA